MGEALEADNKEHVVGWQDSRSPLENQLTGALCEPSEASASFRLEETILKDSDSYRVLREKHDIACLRASFMQRYSYEPQLCNEAYRIYLVNYMKKALTRSKHTS